MSKQHAKTIFFLFLLGLAIPTWAWAGILGESYLSICRSALLRDRWMEDVSLPKGVHWVTDPGELPAVSDGLAEAYSDHPLFSWIVPNPSLRPNLWYTLVRQAYLNGGILTADSPGTASALWFENKKGSAGLLTLLLTGQVFLAPRVGIGNTVNAFRLDGFLTKTRRRLIAEAGNGDGALYLFQVGVKQAARNQGLASQIIRPVLDYADHTRRIVVLEVHKEDNIPVYQKMGFSVGHEEIFPRMAPKRGVSTGHEEISPRMVPMSRVMVREPNDR